MAFAKLLKGTQGKHWHWKDHNDPNKFTASENLRSNIIQAHEACMHHANESESALGKAVSSRHAENKPDKASKYEELHGLHKEAQYHAEKLFKSYTFGRNVTEADHNALEAATAKANAASANAHTF